MSSQIEYRDWFLDQGNLRWRLCRIIDTLLGGLVRVEFWLDYPPQTGRKDANGLIHEAK